MGAFDGLRNAKMFEKGVPLIRNPKPPAASVLSEGFSARFRLEIEKCEVIKTRGKGDAFIAHFLVHDSSHADPTTGSPKGSRRTWYQGLLDADIAFGSLLSFVAAVLGVDPADKERVDAEVRPIAEQAMNEATEKGQIFAGKFVDVECVLTKTKEKQTDFTRHNWAPVLAAA